MLFIIFLYSYFSENFSQGRRRFYVDLRQNPRGRFLKLTQLTPGGRTFVAIPGDGLLKFQEMFCQLLDEFGSSDYSPPGKGVLVYIM